MTAGSCGICLDELKTPVSTLCGHLHCEKCLIRHVEASSDAISASCPTCRASFPIVTPDLRFVPSKYHRYITPSVRRVFVDESSQSSRQMKATVARLEERVKALEQDKVLLMDRCEASMAASTKHAEGERDGRIANEKLRKEMQELRKKYDGLKGKYREVKNLREDSGPSQAVKRKSSQAALDVSATSSFGSSSSQQLFSSEVREAFDLTSKPILRIPKRPRLLGSPFDPSKAFTTGPVARPAVFKKGRASIVMSLSDFAPLRVINHHEDESSTIGSSGGPQRSGLPTGDLFSPVGNIDLNSSRGSIDYGMQDEVINVDEDE